METIRQFFNTLKGKIEIAAQEGNVEKVNEIKANIMLCSIIIMMLLISNLCLLLNEIGIFTADINIMRMTLVAMDIVEIPILVVCRIRHGEPTWMKGLLLWGALAVCALLSMTLGHNVTLCMVIPVLLSLRYCQVNLTRHVVIATVIIFTLACIGNAYFGIVNLNFAVLGKGTSLTIVQNLRQAVLAQPIEVTAYLKNSLINDFLPKMLIFSVIGFCCIRISHHAKEMVDMQHEVSEKSSRLQTELNLATEIQAGMLPCIFPAFPDHGELELFAINYPAKEVGGDFYDYFEIDDDHVAIVMADVSGKGVGAALFMTISKIVLKNQLMMCKSAAAALENANKQLCENNEADLFVTVWCGIYEISTKTLTYADAGHNPPVVHRKNESCYYLKGKKGMVLAAIEESKYKDNVLQLEDGDEIFLYTDGVTEANSKDHELYGEDRLLSFISNHIDEPVMEQINNEIVDLQNFMGDMDQFDDITMLAMRIKE